ncbi:fibroblast growth factor-binding protein 3-like [Hyperolius riggenbachi]|uniref:fibroblast growth factor-binding protein 3-like n=1 Tax=Hyperolius riggenbachi TaxID=752182 RepID=UPI0035A383F1
MRHCSVISFIFLLNCLGALQGVLGKNDKATGKARESPVFARSGQFTTKLKHVCSWEIVGDSTVSLSLSCKEPNGGGYNCTYEGEPQRCPEYTLKAKQYWKPILGKFRRVKNACEDKTLKSRLCKKSEAVESQLRKIEGDTSTEAEKDKAKLKGRVKEPSGGPEGGPSKPEAAENTGAGRKSSGKKKKHDSKSNQVPNPTISPFLPELTTAREVNDDIVEQNENLADTYCDEKWHSMCSFFVNIWNG